jgi:hypothetical protein
MAERPAMTVQQQADFIAHLVDRCTMRDGATARETHLTLDAGEVADLRALAVRLERMAPHENEIRRIVMTARR